MQDWQAEVAHTLDGHDFIVRLREEVLSMLLPEVPQLGAYILSTAEHSFVAFTNTKYASRTWSTQTDCSLWHAGRAC